MTGVSHIHKVKIWLLCCLIVSNSTGKTEVKEQFFVYDSNAVIADVGGYMGLLLGHSLLGMYKYFAGRASRVAKAWFRHKKTKSRMTMSSA